jgi:hypothetical protein
MLPLSHVLEIHLEFVCFRLRDGYRSLDQPWSVLCLDKVSIFFLMLSKELLTSSLSYRPSYPELQIVWNFILTLFFNFCFVKFLRRSLMTQNFRFSLSLIEHVSLILFIYFQVVVSIIASSYKISDVNCA